MLLYVRVICVWYVVCYMWCKKNVMKLNLYLVVVCLIVLPVEVEAEVLELTLRQAVEMAKQNSPDAIAARHSYRSSYWDYRSFRANYLPSLTLTSNPKLDRSINKITLPDGSEKYVSQNMLTVDGVVNLSQNVPFTGGSLFVESTLQRMDLLDDKQFSYRTTPVVVGYNQSIFGYNSLKWNKRIEPIRYDEAKKSFVETLELVAARAAGKFFNLAKAQSNYDIACFNYGNADTLYRYAKGRYDIGTITENELLQLEINQLTEDANRMDAKIDVDDCMQDLRSYLGLDNGAILKVKVEEEVPHFEVNQEQVLDLSNQNSPDVQSRLRRLLESKSAVAQARSSAGLKVDLYLQCGLTQTADRLEDSYRDPLNQQYASIGISLPILDWGRGRGKIKVAKSRYDLVETQVEQERNDFVMNVQKLVSQFNLQAARVAIAAKTDRTAQRRHEVARRLYLLGKSTVLDLNASIAEKDSARRNYIATLSNYWNLYYVLRSMTLYDFEKGERTEAVFPGEE